MTAGYSCTPLPQKIGIKEGHKVGLVGAPTGFDLGTLPTGATQVASLRPRMTQAGGLWIAWPKKASGVPTDIVEDTIRQVTLPTGLVDNKVCEKS
ncbi:MAG: DUF3052 domain-containing protein [Deltaproteobacteria bacterium]|nr:DUF3052 domain-containing protein [Deltaproteobacteria bacterium]